MKIAIIFFSVALVWAFFHKLTKDLDKIEDEIYEDKYYDLKIKEDETQKND